MAEAQEEAFFGHIGMIGLRFEPVGQENPDDENIPIRFS